MNFREVREAKLGLPPGVHVYRVRKPVSWYGRLLERGEVLELRDFTQKRKAHTLSRRAVRILELVQVIPEDGEVVVSESVSVQAAPKPKPAPPKRATASKHKPKPGAKRPASRPKKEAAPSLAENSEPTLAPELAPRPGSAGEGAVGVEKG